MTSFIRRRTPRQAPLAAALLLGALPMLVVPAGCDDSDDDAGSGTDAGSTSDASGSSTTGTSTSSASGSASTSSTTGSGTASTGTSSSTASATDTSSTTSTSSTTDDTTGNTGPVGEFESQVYSPIIAANCSCHVSGAPAGLGMPDATTAYSNLVGVTSTQNSGMPRVDPNDSANSYLWHKLSGSHVESGGSGVQMPRNRPPLGQADIDAVAAWIDAGANP